MIFSFLVFVAAVSGVPMNNTQKAVLSSFLTQLGCTSKICTDTAMPTYECLAVSGSFPPNGITCNFNGDVTGLVVASSIALSGSISGPLLGQLSKLTWLSAVQNSIVGSLPNQIGKRNENDEFVPSSEALMCRFVDGIECVVSMGKSDDERHAAGDDRQLSVVDLFRTQKHGSLRKRMLQTADVWVFKPFL